MNSDLQQKKLIAEIREALDLQIEEGYREKAGRYFKEKVDLYGVRMPVIRKISKDIYRKIPDPEKALIFSVCDVLWESGILEESMIASHWSYYIRKEYVPQDFIIFEKWIRENINNWASCDTFCNHTMGEFIELFPEYLKRLKEFCLSENRWKRRAAAVSLIIPARKGNFLEEIFEIAGILLHDRDDLVQKGYGWMLKAASESKMNEVFDFVMDHRLQMPRTALRYAIEKMPDDMRKQAMKKN